MTTSTTETTRTEVAREILRRQRFIVTCHVRPDGDAIGSEMAMAFALRHLGKEVRVVNRDAPPPPMLEFPGVSDIEIRPAVDDPADAVIVMESGDLPRTGVAGFEHGFVINIDHHPGNTLFGALNWLDLSAAACGEMVFDLIDELGVPLTREIATHIYVAILTDTGSFHYANITPRTFEICRRCLEVGVNAAQVARSVFDNYSLCRLKLTTAVLGRMQLDESGRIASLFVTHEMARECGGTYEDTEGVVNQPLSVKQILAVIFLKEDGPDDWRVSLRSKGDVDVNAIAKQFGGGGHKNASGCSATGALDDLLVRFRTKVRAALDHGGGGAA